VANGNLKKDNKNKGKRAQESSSEDEKPAKKSKMVNVTKEDNMYDSDRVLTYTCH